MTSNEQFHELFTPVAWEIYTSYLSELKALMEKYQINENRYSFIKKNLDNHVSNWIKDAKVIIIDEREIQTIFHEVGQPLELLLALGFRFECRKCKTVRVDEKATCGSCETPHISPIFSISILGSAQFQKLKQWIFTHPLAKITLFLLIGVTVGIGSTKLPLNLICWLVLIGIIINALNHMNFPSSKFDDVLEFFFFHFIIGLALIYIALMDLVNLLMYDFEGNEMLFREELIPVIAILVIVLLWMINQPKNRLNYFKYIQLQKQSQFRFMLQWLFVIITFVILIPAFGVLLSIIATSYSELREITVEYFKIIEVSLFIVFPLLSGLIQLFVLIPYLTRFREKNSVLES